MRLGSVTGRLSGHDGKPTQGSPRNEDLLGLRSLPRAWQLGALAFMWTMRLAATTTTGDEEVSLLIPERHGSQYLLMRYASPSDPSRERLATFDSHDAMMKYVEATGTMMKFAREVGRSGLA